MLKGGGGGGGGGWGSWPAINKPTYLASFSGLPQEPGNKSYVLKEYVLIWTLNLPPTRTSNHVTVVLSHVQKKKGKTQPSRTTSDLSPSQSRTDSRSGGGRKTKMGGKATLSRTGSVSVSTHTHTYRYMST